MNAHNDNEAKHTVTATHTPGPWWSSHGDEVYAPGLAGTKTTQTVADAVCADKFNPFRPDAATAKANARLIAAAPDLLTALEAIELHLSLHPGSSVKNRKEAQLVLDTARAAIAKARGE